MATIKEYWNTWLWRDAVTRLVTVNFFVWLAVGIGLMVAGDQRLWLQWFVLPGVDKFFPERFWTIVTYMFTHVDFMHMLVNMTWLLIFGRLFCHLQSGRRLVVLYIYGGLSGGAAFLVYNALGGAAHSGVLGASCAVLAVIGAVMVMAPNWQVPLFLFGEVKVLWIGIAAVVLFVVMQPSPDTFAAHLAGLLAGVVYAVLRRHDIDIAKPALRLGYYIESALNGSLSSRPGRQLDDRADEDMLDELLAKVSNSGYASLSPSERQRLFELSQKLKK